MNRETRQKLKIAGAKGGRIGGKARVKKGIAMYLEKLTDEERTEFYRKRNLKRWPNGTK
jgi:hypothetical protein